MNISTIEKSQAAPSGTGTELRAGRGAPKKRDISIDILRGIAVFTMIGANLAGPMLAAPPPYWFRLYGSFAAPTFILVAGMMMAFTSGTRHYGARHFLARGLMVMAVAAAIDLFVWNMVPFMSVDVLYLVGLALPLAYFFLRLKVPARWSVALAVFAAAPVLQKVFGYTDFPGEIHFLGQAPTVNHPTGVLQHWLVDGWFPVFPWLGFSLLGANLAARRWDRGHGSGPDRTELLAGLSLLAVGGTVWTLDPGAALMRDGYIELFYPPTLGYLATAAGVVIILLSLIDVRPSLAAFKPLQALGECALFMYALHLALIRYLIAPAFHKVGFQAFFWLYAALSLSLIASAYGLRTLRKAWPERPYFARFLMG